MKKEDQALRLLEGIKGSPLQEKTNSILKAIFSNIKTVIQNYNMGFITNDESIQIITEEIDKTLNRIYSVQMNELKKENRDHLEEIIFKNS